MKTIKIDATGSDINADWIKTIGDYQAQDLAAHEAIAGTREKHLPGQHDQSEHGNWAHGRQDDPARLKGSGDYLNDELQRQGVGWFIKPAGQGGVQNQFKRAIMDPDPGVVGELSITEPGLNVFTDSEASRQKDDIVSTLRARAGVEYNQANEIIRSWAWSSNDTSYTSLMAQKAAAEVMGVEMSDWQKDNFDKTIKNRQASLEWNKNHPDLIEEYDRLLSTRKEVADHAEKANNRIEAILFVGDKKVLPHHTDEYNQLTNDLENTRAEYARINQRIKDIDLMAPSGFVTLNNSIKSPFEDKYGRRLPGKYKDDASAFKSVLQEMYKQTQLVFQLDGVKELIVFRGAGFPRALNVPQGGLADLTANALESWTLRRDIADAFAHSRQGHQYVFGMRIPVERVFCTARTGFGCLNEFEVVIFNGKDPDEVAIVYKRNP